MGFVHSSVNREYLKST